MFGTKSKQYLHRYRYRTTYLPESVRTRRPASRDQTKRGIHNVLVSNFVVALVEPFAVLDVLWEEVLLVTLEAMERHDHPIVYVMQRY